MEIIGKKKTIGFDNCERYFAKASFGIKGVMEIPELDGTKPNDFLTKLFQLANNNIKKEAVFFEEQKKEYEKLMNEIVPQIEKMETQEDLTSMTKLNKETNHILTSEKELKHKFKEKVAELGYQWNSDKKEYEKVSNNTDITE